tara:strand:+ start:488 stop:1306 length:819 start_codon:yes stop_codon:yes gene_type:complete
LNPLIILGAPRSGTNILRDTLCTSESFRTWDCDEINYIWRIGSAFKSSDELKKDELNNYKKSYILKAFKKIQKSDKNVFVVEKTCANCLRLEFLYEIFPKANYIYIKRDPFDSISSISERWKGETSNKYLYKKAKYIPKIDIPYYVLRYLSHRFIKKFSKSKELPTWGPRFNNIDKFRKEHLLIETCAKQWYECTNQVENAIEKLKFKNIKILKLNYENFVSSPDKSLHEVNQFLNLKDNTFKTDSINSFSIGKGKNKLSDMEKNLISQIIK